MPAATVIDLHCHVLPGIDDGPPTLGDSLELARAAVAASTTTIIATPHVSWDYPANSAALIADRVALVNEALAAAVIPLHVLAGAEIAMTRATDLSDDELLALRLGGGPYLLIECPHTPSVAGFDEVFRWLQDKGHRIVVAHPERCPALQRNPDAVQRYAEQGMLMQVTASSLTGRFGKPVQQFAEHLMRAGLVHNIASDAHGAQGGRPPGVLAHLDAAGLSAQADWLTRAMPAAIISGEPLPPAPAMPTAPPPGLRQRLLRRR